MISREQLIKDFENALLLNQIYDLILKQSGDVKQAQDVIHYLIRIGERNETEVYPGTIS